MKPIDLAVSPRVIESVRWAERFTGAEQHEDARRAALQGLQQLCRAMGLTERTTSAIWALAVSDGGNGESEFELARARGQIIDELASVYSHERDGREALELAEDAVHVR